MHNSKNYVNIIVTQIGKTKHLNNSHRVILLCFLHFAKPYTQNVFHLKLEILALCAICAIVSKLQNYHHIIIILYNMF